MQPSPAKETERCPWKSVNVRSVTSDTRASSVQVGTGGKWNYDYDLSRENIILLWQMIGQMIIFEEKEPPFVVQIVLELL